MAERPILDVSTFGTRCTARYPCVHSGRAERRPGL